VYISFGTRMKRMGNFRIGWKATWYTVAVLALCYCIYWSVVLSFWLCYYACLWTFRFYKWMFVSLYRLIRWSVRKIAAWIRSRRAAQA